MNKWNYRILAHREEGGIVLQMHEVYYDEDNSPSQYTENPAVVIGDDISDIAWVLIEMRAARMKPVLWAGEMFPQEYKP